MMGEVLHIAVDGDVGDGSTCHEGSSQQNEILAQQQAADVAHLCAVHFSAPFGAPGHRDYLGAILGLGIRREWVGDILVQEHGAYVFCLPSVVKTLAEKYGIENNARICELHRKCNKYL